jgi:hypothetical protein
MKSNDLFGTMMLYALAAATLVTVMVEGGFIIWIPVLMALAIVAGMQRFIR